jgi:hypothetical protein
MIREKRSFLRVTWPISSGSNPGSSVERFGIERPVSFANLGFSSYMSRHASWAWKNRRMDLCRLDGVTR